MGILARAATKAFDQGVGTIAAGQHISQLGMVGRSKAGINVTAEKALSYGANLAAVRTLAESVAALPLHVYRRLDGGGDEIAREHPLDYVLHHAANPEMVAFVWRETSMIHATTYSMVYSMIARDRGGRGDVRELWPLRPERMRVDRNDADELVFIYRKKNGEEQRFARRDIFYVPVLSWDGTTGIPLLKAMRETFGLGLAAEEYGSRFFANDATPGFALMHPETLSDTALEHLEDSWAEKHQGLSNSSAPAILEEGMKPVTLGVDPDKAQFLDTRKLQRTETAAGHRLPPHMIGDPEHATFSNIEHQSLEFVKHTLLPWLVRWEQSMDLQLLGGDPRYFVKFNADALLRGDLESRMKAYVQAIQNGIWSPDEVREREDQNKRPDGKGGVYLQPMNMVPAGMVAVPKGAAVEVEDLVPVAPNGNGHAGE